MSRGNEKKGESHRTARVEREIRDVVGRYLVAGFRGQLPGLVSITRVSVSADLKIANINVTLIMTRDENEETASYEKREQAARKEAVRELNEFARDVQSELAHELQMRFTPKVHFFYDEGFESALKVERTIRDLERAHSGNSSSSRDDEGQ